MASWAAFVTEAPDLAMMVERRFSAHAHKTMATLRADGSPRISGTEVTLHDGELWLGGMPGSMKMRDLRRDPRLAIHSGSDDPEEWKGDAKVAGTAVEVTDPATRASFVRELGEQASAPFDLFRVDLTEAVAVSLADTGDHLVIEFWRPGGGVRRVQRR